jgi:two-component system, OmpR family, phosphate regulon sensor histidine kinase PhoR
MKRRPVNKFIIIIIIALFAPIFTYTVYQFSKRNENEQLIKSIYNRQLESILFSINQHCWDIFNNWQSEMTSAAAIDYENFLQLFYTPKIQDIIDAQPVITSGLIRFAPEYFVVGNDRAYAGSQPRRRQLIQKVNTVIIEAHEELERSTRLAKEGYIKPYAAHWQSYNFDNTLLLFPILKSGFSNSGVIYGGLLIDNRAFVERIVARRFTSMNDGEFVLAIQENNSPDFLYYSTEMPPEGKFEQSSALWILPDLQLKIKMTGTTLERLSQDQTRTNLIFLAVVNIVIIIGLVYVVRNVSKEMELAKIKTNLVANVSHEIRTPIALIRLYAETLQMGRLKDEEKKNKYYKTMLAESIHLTQLINNMLDFSKIESKKKEYRKSPNDIGKLAWQVLEMYHHNFEQKGFSIETDIAENLSLVNIDVEAITQAFVNLLDNAMKYSNSEKYIGIEIKQSNRDIMLSVTDHGIGIPEAEQKKIFQKFYRVGDSLVHNTKGSGLGLSLVEHIIKVHGGEVIIDSTVGEGSTFSLTFPIINISGA